MLEQLVAKAEAMVAEQDKYVQTAAMPWQGMWERPAKHC